MQKMRFPSLPRFEPKTYDHSAFKLFKDCHRKYFYRIILGRTPPRSKYQVIFDFGKAYHSFREVLEREYQTHKNAELACAVAMKVAMDSPLVHGEGKYEFYTKQLLAKTCLTAFEHWQNEKKKGAIEVIAIEQPFNIELGNGKFISGRADQIVRWNGYVWGRDFKTTSKIEQYFTATLDPNDQATRYIYAESKLTFGSEAIKNGKFIKGIIFEVIQNTKTTQPKIYNSIITKNRYQLETWEREQLFLHRLMDICIAEDEWAMHEGNCTFCDYAKVCKAPSEASMENILKNDFNLSPWNHELVEQVIINET
jgi:hypothetical protein